MKHWILSREGSLSIILVIWLFNSCVLKLKYASLVDIFKNYFSCFKDKEGHLLIAPLLNYMMPRAGESDRKRCPFWLFIHKKTVTFCSVLIFLILPHKLLVR